ncbi:MAG: GIN domain-containing protein [Steroidobacteraceae bacterium]
MTRNVTLIAIIGIATAAVCLPLAGLLGHGNPDSGWGWSGLSGARGWHGPWSNRWFDNGFGDEGGADTGNIVSREFDWSGGDRLQLDVPGTLHFRPAPEWHLSIRGHSGTLDRIVVEDGRIRLRRPYRNVPPVDVQLSGPALRDVELNGSGDLVLGNLKQDTLSVAIHGSGSASAAGSVDTLRVAIMGSGSARLAQLAAGSARIFIAGSGNADVAPSNAADIFIAGSGDVRLHSHPKRLNSRVAGSGRISEVPGDPAGATGAAGTDQTGPFRGI